MFTELKSREESLKKRLANDAITVKNRKRAREEQEFRLKLDCLEKVTNRIEDGIGQCKKLIKITEHEFAIVWPYMKEFETIETKVAGSPDTTRSPQKEYIVYLE